MKKKNMNKKEIKKLIVFENYASEQDKQSL